MMQLADFVDNLFNFHLCSKETIPYQTVISKDAIGTIIIVGR